MGLQQARNPLEPPAVLGVKQEVKTEAERARQ
jgi:hypothetical protein